MPLRTDQKCSPWGLLTWAASKAEMNVPSFPGILLFLLLGKFLIKWGIFLEQWFSDSSLSQHLLARHWRVSTVWGRRPVIIIWSLDGNCWSPAFPTEHRDLSGHFRGCTWTCDIWVTECGRVRMCAVPSLDSGGPRVYLPFSPAPTSWTCHYRQTWNWVRDVNKYIWGIFIT